MENCNLVLQAGFEVMNNLKDHSTMTQWMVEGSGLHGDQQACYVWFLVAQGHGSVAPCWVLVTSFSHTFSLIIQFVQQAVMTVMTFFNIDPVQGGRAKSVKERPAATYQ